MIDAPTTADLPKLGIQTKELIEHVNGLLDQARALKTEKFGAVNWGDLGVSDIEYRLSVMHPAEGPYCMVTVEEASPGCVLQTWLNAQVDHDRFPNTYIECEW